MPDFLTSWKEIAQYLGKGVRTVQRWERERGLPIRGNRVGHKRLVLAVKTEIDDWIHSLHSSVEDVQSSKELESKIVLLQSENESLRRQLEMLQHSQHSTGWAKAKGLDRPRPSVLRN